jgi:hypothetical protein
MTDLIAQGLYIRAQIHAPEAGPAYRNRIDGRVTILARVESLCYNGVRLEGMVLGVAVVVVVVVVVVFAVVAVVVAAAVVLLQLFVCFIVLFVLLFICLFCTVFAHFQL